MSNKANPKEFAKQCRKLVILADLTIDTIDELKKHGPVEGEFKKNLEAVKAKCEETVTAAYSVDSVLNSTYVGDMVNKLDTMIRKNFDIN